jgi:D-arabinose 1-dehydrogenase-like Zn-dependent alcohol dehydrogenase
MESRPTVQLGPDDVYARMQTCALCRSDLELIMAKAKRRILESQQIGRRGVVIESSDSQWQK